jgi:hypothetical protein
MVAKTLTRWYGKTFNNRVSRRLRSPKHSSLSGNHLLISFDGIKSGKRYTLPVNYKKTPEGTIVIGTESRWWRNLERGANVEMVLDGKVTLGFAKPVTNDLERRERLGRMLAGFTWRWFAKSLVIIEISTE